MIDNYRVRYYSHVNQELKYRPHPYFGYTRLDRGGQDAINSLNFWGPEWAVEKPSGTVRIVALGGSTTAGPTAWPYQLEELLQREVDGVDGRSSTWASVGGPVRKPSRHSPWWASLSALTWSSFTV